MQISQIPLVDISINCSPSTDLKARQQNECVHQQTLLHILKNKNKSTRISLSHCYYCVNFL